MCTYKDNLISPEIANLHPRYTLAFKYQHTVPNISGHISLNQHSLNVDFNFAMHIMSASVRFHCVAAEKNKNRSISEDFLVKKLSA